MLYKTKTKKSSIFFRPYLFPQKNPVFPDLLARTGSGVTGSEQVSRCLTLLSQDEGAAVAFFSRLHKTVGVPSAAKVIAMLVRCVLVAARTPPPPEAGNDGDDEARQEGGDQEGDEGAGQAKHGKSRKGKRKGVDNAATAAAASKAKNDGKGGGLSLKASDPKV